MSSGLLPDDYVIQFEHNGTLYRDVYANFSILDVRYWMEELVPYLSVAGYTEYLLQVELAVIKAQVKHGLCPASVITEVEEAIPKVRAHAVYKQEKITKHDIVALVDVLQSFVTPLARRYIHRFVT